MMKAPLWETRISISASKQEERKFKSRSLALLVGVLLLDEGDHHPLHKLQVAPKSLYESSPWLLLKKIPCKIYIR